MLSHVCDDDAYSYVVCNLGTFFSRVISFNQKLIALVEIFSCAAGKCLLFISYRIGCGCVFFFLFIFIIFSSKVVRAVDLQVCTFTLRRALVFKIHVQPPSIPGA